MLKIKRVIHSRKKMFNIAGRYNDSKFACHLKRYKAKPKRTKRRNKFTIPLSVIDGTSR